MAKNYEIDNVDLKILNLLKINAKMAYTEIAKKVFVSSGTVHVRMKKMEAMGIVKKTTLKLDYTKLGYDITCFLGIYLQKSSLYGVAVEELKKIPEIVKIHYTTGKYNIFAKLYCKDTKHLKEILHDKIQQVEGIDSTETIISLERSMSRPLKL